MPQEGSALLLIPVGKLREVLFVPPRMQARKTEAGHLLTHDEARKISGIDEVWDTQQLNHFLAVLLPAGRDPCEAPEAAGPPLPEDLGTMPGPTRRFT